MCTVLLSIAPRAAFPVLMLNTRDEFTDRRWEPPGPWWPRNHRGVIGGYDRQAGGSWLAVHPQLLRVATVLNGPELPHPDPYPHSRGALPLRAVSRDRLPDRTVLHGTRPFHLLVVSPTAVLLESWDGRRLSITSVGAGMHVLSNDGLDRRDHRSRAFLSWLRDRSRPEVDLHRPAEACWTPWTDLLRGPRLNAAVDRQPLVVHECHGERVRATLAVSALAVGPESVRYDFGQPDIDRTSSMLHWRRIL